MRSTGAFCLAQMTAGSLLAFAATQTSAQTTASPPAPAPDTNDIVVTAQKRSEKLVDVPIAISAVSGAALASSNINSTEALGQAVPGLRLDRSAGTLQPTVRGVGSSQAGPGLTSAVALYVDGIYQPSPVAVNFELTDIDSIQVLKGPQGTLFGRNATGGAIMITSKKPSFDTAIDGSVSYARFNDVRTQGRVSTGLSDTIAFSLTGLYHRSDGFVKDIVTGKDAAPIDSWTIRAKLLWQPSTTASVLLSYDHSRVRDDSAIALNAYQGRTVAALVDPMTPIPTQRGQVALTDDTHFFIATVDSVTLRSEIDFAFANLVSYTGYQSSSGDQSVDLDATRAGILQVAYNQLGKTVSQEFNLTSNGGGPFKWVVGAYYFHDISKTAFRGGGTVPLPVLYRPRITAESFAVFADGTYEVVPNLFFTVGGRYNTETSERFMLITGVPEGPLTDQSRRFNSFTPRAVLRYNLDRNSNVYASFSKGFKSGGFNPSSLDPSFNPEKITSYEIGFKTSQSIFHAEVSGYYYDYKDLQVTAFTNGVGFIRNAAKSRVYGADVQVGVRPAMGLSIDFGASYINARYKNFTGAPAYKVGEIATIDAIDATGLTMARAPKFTGNASIAYDYKVGESKLRFFGSYYYTSKFYFDPVEQFPQKAYGLLGARITYYAPGDKYHIGVFGNNLADVNYLSQVLPVEGAAIAQAYGQPRTYGVEVGFKF